jgi:hypothetical protein
MSLGLCLGSVGVGKCGSTTSEQAVNISNTAIAQAYMQSVFNCNNDVQGGNNISAGGCSCAQMGYKTDAACLAAQKEAMAYRAKICAQSLVKLNKDDPAIVCLCNISGGGCNAGVTQDSFMSVNQNCKSLVDAKTKLDQEFFQNIKENLKVMNSDIGALFDSGSEKNLLNLANSFTANVSTQTITNISSKITAQNSVKATCGGININVSQYAKLQAVLDNLSDVKAFTDLQQALKQEVEVALEKQNNGFLGWLNNNYWVIIVIAVVLIGAFCFYWFYWRKRGLTGLSGANVINNYYYDKNATTATNTVPQIVVTPNA